ncbi:MAG: Rieske 2Fe-2S domain-containing protein [Chloroflexota bacterium]
MLSVEANERLTRVGKGTPMGELMRRYWVPIRPFAMLLEDPVLKVRILGEDLVLFRTLKGELGLIGDRCPHRNAGLEYGIPNEDGLRCPYHGWMMDPTGQCIDTPLESKDSTFKDKIKITGYPVQEMGGLVWAYMGPAPAPLLAPWDLFVFPNAMRQIGICEIPCNWLQCHENTGDPAHSVYVHGELFKYSLEKMGRVEERQADKPQHTIMNRIKSGVGIKSIWARPTKYGMEKGIDYSRELGADKDHTARHSTVVFPFFTQTGGPHQVRQEFQIRVPIDDEHTYHIAYGCYLSPQAVEVPKQEIIPYYVTPALDANGRPILDYVIAQDAIAWWSQGAITNRNTEKLGRTDVPIILMRRQFEQQMRIVEDGGDPMNTFRDPAAMPELIHGGSWEERLGKGQEATTAGNFRNNYHKGLWLDDGDRYGSTISQINDLMRRIEEHMTSKA